MGGVRSGSDLTGGCEAEAAPLRRVAMMTKFEVMWVKRNEIVTLSLSLVLYRIQIQKFL